jgi:hypothetical protein
MKVEITKDYENPGGGQLKKGQIADMTREGAAKAVADGVAKYLNAPKTQTPPAAQTPDKSN